MNILLIVGIALLGATVGMIFGSIIQLKNPQKILKTNSNKKKPGETDEQYLKRYKTNLLITGIIFFVLGIILVAISLF